MCGIAGIVSHSWNGSRLRETAEKMVLAIQHRGPDHMAVLVSEPAVLAHSRLSILDLSGDGNQPMTSDDGRYTLVCNGEIYNFRELRDILIREGCRFRGNSDSEVILQGYVVWGRNVVHRLKGMFAFAVWDAVEERLYLARDRFGIKPLYYLNKGGAFLFGSEIKALLSSGMVAREVDSQGLSEFLWFGNSISSGSLFKEINELAPGHMMVIDDGAETIEPFWLPESVKEVPMDRVEAVDETWKSFEKAIQSHLVSDVPIGVFLSGGLDSSAITWCASRHMSGSLATYSVGFDYDRGINELSKAKAVAQHCGTDHNELHVTAEAIPELVEDLLECHDEPFADAANIPLYLLCREIKGRKKVVLQGDGGDEILAGYERHRVMSYWKPVRVLAEINRYLGFLAPKIGRWRGARRFLEALGQSDPGLRMAFLLTVERIQAPPERLVRGELNRLLRTCDPFRRYRECADRFSDKDPLQQLLFTDTQVILAEDFLKKVDRSTMAHGIEVRVPFLDADFSERVMSLPSSLKIRQGQTKWLLREGLKGRIPESILNAPKTGFGTPYSYWLRTSLKPMLRETLLSNDSSLLKHLDTEAVRRLIDEHSAETAEHGNILWKLLQLGIWMKKYNVNIC
jgi:asparagine synthase (glutamine-hydrolysing)